MYPHQAGNVEACGSSPPPTPTHVALETKKLSYVCFGIGTEKPILQGKSAHPSTVDLLPIQM